MNSNSAREIAWAAWKQASTDPVGTAQRTFERWWDRQGFHLVQEVERQESRVHQDRT